MRREYAAKLTVNGVSIERVVIDLHYQEKHGESVNDGIILQLVDQLDGQFFRPDEVKDGFEYFKYDPAYLQGKTYQLVWLRQKDCIYIGVVNCFRRD